MGRTEGAISRWVNGITEAKMDELVRIHQITGVSVDYLLGLVSDPHGHAGVTPALAPAALPSHEALRLAKRLESIEDDLRAARELAGLKK